MSTQEPAFIPLPPEWQTRQTVAITTFAYRGHCYTVSTIDLATTQNYALLQSLATLRDELKPGSFLPALRYETRVFMDGEDAYMFKQVYDTREEAESGHKLSVEQVKQLLIQAKEVT